MNTSVFLSYPRPYNDQQTAFIDEVKKHLLDHGFEPRTLGVSDYGFEEPLTQVRRLLLESNGLVAVAFRRYSVEKGEIKTSGEDISGKYFSSAWCQLEPAMAFQLGLPILIYREKDVIDDGIFEKGVAGIYLPEFDLSKPIAEYFDSEEWKQIVGDWEGCVRAVRKAKGMPPRLY